MVVLFWKSRFYFSSAVVCFSIFIGFDINCGCLFVLVTYRGLYYALLIHCCYARRNINDVICYAISVQFVCNWDTRIHQQLLATSEGGSCTIYVYMLLSGWFSVSVVLWRWLCAIGNNTIFVLASRLCTSYGEIWQSTLLWAMAQGKFVVQLSLAAAIKASLSYTELRTSVLVFLRNIDWKIPMGATE